MANPIGSRITEHGDRRQRRYPGRVLLVSGRADERRLLADCLNSRGFCALEAQSAPDAYQLACEVAVSVIITDVDLPGDDGFCLARRLKGNHRIQQVPVVILADGMFDDVCNAAGDAGCDLVSTRAAPHIVVRLINRLLSRRRKVRAHQRRN